MNTVEYLENLMTDILMHCPQISNDLKNDISSSRKDKSKFNEYFWYKQRSKL